MTPKQGWRSALGKSSGSAGGPAAARRLGLLVFGGVFAALFLGIGIAVGIGHPSVPSGEVAIVEDVPGEGGRISNQDFRHAFVQSAAQAGLKTLPKPGDKQYEQVKEATLSNLLETAWLEGQAAEMGIAPSEKEVQQELAKLKKSTFKSESEYKSFLKKAHYTAADVIERVRLTILTRQIQQQFSETSTTPSKSEIEDYYEEAKATQFTQHATRDVRLILNKDEKKAEAAKAALANDSSAASWKKLAKKYSEDTTTQKSGGLQKGVSEGTLEEPLNAAVFSAPEKQVEGPVKTGQGYYVFEVEGSTPETVQQLKDVETQIKTQLSQRAQQEAFSAWVADYTTRWQSRTFCASGYTTERCANSKGSAHPSTAPPGCYEANPKGGLPEACPAPVSQLTPALPGSVTVIEPRGQQLAQRPRPAGLEPAGQAPTLPGTIPPTTP